MAGRFREGNAAGRLYLFLHHGRYHGSSRDTLFVAWNEYFAAAGDRSVVIRGLDQILLLPEKLRNQYEDLPAERVAGLRHDISTVRAVEVALAQALDLDLTLRDFRAGLSDHLMQSLDTLSSQLEKSEPSRPLKRPLALLRTEVGRLADDIHRASIVDTVASARLLNQVHTVLRAIDQLKVIGPEGVAESADALREYLGQNSQLGSARLQELNARTGRLTLSLLAIVR